MKVQSVETVIQALNEAKIRYLVAGGLAVVAHGYLRFTADLDLIFHLEESNLKKALSLLKSLGYKPSITIPKYHDHVWNTFVHLLRCSSLTYHRGYASLLAPRSWSKIATVIIMVFRNRYTSVPTHF
jgi:hypothetical protein